MKDLLGGKGSGLAEMTNAGLPVPPGFTIYDRGLQLLVRRTSKQAPAGRRRRDDRQRPQAREAGGRDSSGRPTNPLLVSVRSGAKFSMPGMMDTILNLGLNDVAVEGLKARTGNGRFAYDSYRRFIQMFGSVVLEIPKDKFEHEFEGVKTADGAATDTDLGEDGLREMVARYKALVKAKTASAFPQDADRPAAQARVTPCSARGTTRARSPTAASTRFPTTSARPSTCR